MKTVNQYIVRGRQTASRIWGKTAIIVLLPGGVHKKEEIYTLGPESTFLWSLLGDKVSIQEIIDGFMRKFRMKEKNARQDVLCLIRNLKDREMIEVLEN